MLMEHLKSRRLSHKLYSGMWLDEEENVATFGMWNLSGQLVGFQQYRPLADKGHRPKPSDMRYFNIAGKVDKCSKLLAFGVELLDQKQRVLFLAEGVFDVVPLHNRNVNALATMANNPKHLASWLRTLGYYLVALCEGDSAGQKLANVADESVYLPEGKDPAEMSEEWFDELVKKYK
jgi:hypothetical protein